MTKTKIFVFCNSCPNPGKGDWHSILAMGDDGRNIARHICSNHGFIRQDMGFEGDWKHDFYDEAYGEGNWELVYVPDAKTGNCPGLDEAYKKNQELAKEAQNETIA